MNRKKLSILSNNYQPNKTFKKGKLKKPQSQKEPTLNYPRDFANVNKQTNVYSGNYYNPVPSLVPDENESYKKSQFYNNFERSTTSSGGSINLMPRWDSYTPGIQTYPQTSTDYWVNQPTLKPKLQSFEKESRMYPPGYYYQAGPPPGFEMSQPMIPIQQTNVVYNDYMHSQMIPVQSYTSKNLLDPTIPVDSYQSEGKLNFWTIFCYVCGFLIKYVVSNFNQDTADSKKLKSPVKEKKGFRKVKSTNEKSMPIDPSARSLIFNCDKKVEISEKLETLKGQLDLLIYNQSGSRFLQKLLTKANKEVVEFFLNEIDSKVNKLMMDKYGNYFCQELLLSCSGTQRLEILK